MVRIGGNVLFAVRFGFELALVLGGTLQVALAGALLAAFALAAIEFAFATALAALLAATLLFLEEVALVVGEQTLIGALHRLKRVGRNLELHLGDFLARELLNAAQQVARVGRHERHGEAIGARAARTANAMHVIFGHHG